MGLLDLLPILPCALPSASAVATLPAKQVAWVRFLVPARPMFIVEKWLFYITLRQGARSQALQLRLKTGLNNLQ
jgi:hypothetical protein